MSEKECTALGLGEIARNPLFTPPCDCPDCAPDQTYDHTRDDGWLRISGRAQRYRVEVVELGATGKALLG